MLRRAADGRTRARAFECLAAEFRVVCVAAFGVRLIASLVRHDDVDVVFAVAAF